MKFDIVLVGIGGEGVQTVEVIIAKAASIEGYHVRGVQLHGLAQRGGLISTFVRFGSEKEIYSPITMQANADLVFAFEQLEAARAIYYARKKKTVFVMNDCVYMPVYANLLNINYPNASEVIKKIKPFAKKIHFLKTSDISKKEFGELVFGNLILVGFAVGKGLLPLKKESLIEAIKETVPREVEKNLKAFEMGLKFKNVKL